MNRTMFSLGLPSRSEPWGYQHSLGISLKEAESWWSTNGPTIQQDLSNAQAAGIGPSGLTSKPSSTTTKPSSSLPMAPMTTPGAYGGGRSSGGSDSTMLVVLVLLAGGGAAGYYFWQKSKQKGGKNGAAKAAKPAKA